MKWRLDAGQIEVVDDAVAEVMRRKTFAERIAMAAQLQRLAHALIEGRLRSDHPDWDDERIATEIARRIRRGAD
jgi:ABC-type transport system involved in cytochrome bd biosynthesis fused ATPase/permease subunit